MEVHTADLMKKGLRRMPDLYVWIPEAFTPQT